MKKQPERIEKIRTLRNALEKVHHTVIVVVRGKQGVFEYFHIDAEVLKNTNGKYPLSQISGQERKRLKEKYGADKIWDVEEIYQVGQGISGITMLWLSKNRLLNERNRRIKDGK